MGRATSDTAPAIVFLVLYLAVFAVLANLYATKAVKWRSRYSFVLFHIIMRITGMALGVAFSCLTWEQDRQARTGVLVAYIVFAAEGYFSLILCTSRFLIVWQQDRLGRSELEPRIPKGTPTSERIKKLVAAPILWFEYQLAAANAIIVAGSSIMSQSITNPDNPDAHSKSTTGKAMRIAGTGVFLGLVQAIIFLAILSYRKRGDRTLVMILLTWPFLTARGIYGILTVVKPGWSYSNPAAYGPNGFTSTFLAAEYAMGIATEWITCVLLLGTHFSALNGGDDLVEDHYAEDTDKLRARGPSDVEMSHKLTSRRSSDGARKEG